ncbi:putative retrotransposon hot spot (RHS) protein [Trypanosoma conorhini]|uniref:Putative retrotransposon hot spot (RHS) protein n=1 Tax=Trypanosoma conorhini TaxID=83891 RepID=A0A422NAI9_9TRYP|nr:putative retrotransposon hot spot (RHS) protein [Trypanosoma conorhini]RNF02475.1 putative retrotransposon hot spot (RHS) protein [Trypanosoma conorhini]
MSGRGADEVHAAAAAAEESPASDVPQGRRHARSQHDGDPTEPATRRRRSEAAPQRPKWTLDSRVQEVLMEGEEPIGEMTLNEFLQKFLGRKEDVNEGNSALMRVVARHPCGYVKDKKLLKKIYNVPEYQALFYACELEGEAVGTLHEWRELGTLCDVPPAALRKLDAALAEAEEEKERRDDDERAARDEEKARRPLPEGFYGSVLMARWSHVLGFPEGDGGMRMEVHEGQRPTQSWVFKPRGTRFVLNNAAEQLSPPRPRLMVLSSAQGWPHSLREGAAPTDCYVTAGVERVWKSVEGTLHDMFVRDVPRFSHPKPFFLLGAEGIGKPMNVGFYLLYRLLHYDAEQFQVVVYCFGAALAYVFDKSTETVTEHEGEFNIRRRLERLSWYRRTGYMIYDASEEEVPPSVRLQLDGWDMVVLAPPRISNFDAWEGTVRARRLFMRSPDKDDVKAMCAWRTRDRPAEKQKEYWEMVKGRMRFLGPLPSCILDEDECGERTEAVDGALQASTAPVAEEDCAREGDELRSAGNPLPRSLEVEREGGEHGWEIIRTAPPCDHIEQKKLDSLAEVVGPAEPHWPLPRAFGSASRS